MNYPYTCDGMLTLECQSQINPLLTKSQASELTARVSKDINAVLKVTKQSALVFCGAAFPSEQLLQPQFPIQKSIYQYASAAFQGQLNADQILSIGASEDSKSGGSMPDGLHPQPSSQNLLHLPFCLYTHDLDLAERFEAELMHKGMVSPPTYAKLSELMQTTINHANYMTYMDLVAMMHNHYEQLGLSHLWQLIETALVSKEPKTAVQTDTNNHFFLVDHLLFTPFFSWSQFCQYFDSSDSEAYITWLMAQRLSLGAFAAHGLQIKPFNTSTWPLGAEKICLGEFEKKRINNNFWKEAFSDSPNNNQTQVVQYNHPQAGTVALALLKNNQPTLIYYPINPQGLKEIDQHIHQLLGDDYVTINRDFNNHCNQLIQA